MNSMDFKEESEIYEKIDVIELGKLRKKLLKQVLQEFKNLSIFNAKAIVLFGSLVNKISTISSDIDLYVLSSDSGLHNLRTAVKEIKPFPRIFARVLNENLFLNYIEKSMNRTKADFKLLKDYSRFINGEVLYNNSDKLGLIFERLKEIDFSLEVRKLMSKSLNFFDKALKLYRSGKNQESLLFIRKSLDLAILSHFVKKGFYYLDKDLHMDDSNVIEIIRNNYPEKLDIFLRLNRLNESPSEIAFFDVLSSCIELTSNLGLSHPIHPKYINDQIVFLLEKVLSQEGLESISYFKNTEKP